MPRCKNCDQEFGLPIPYEKANALRDYCPDCILRLHTEGVLRETVLGEPVIVSPMKFERQPGEVYLEDFL